MDIREIFSWLVNRKGIQILDKAIKRSDRKWALSQRTTKINDRGGRIVLKKADGTYLYQYTHIPSGPNGVEYVSDPKFAMIIDNLEWAFNLARLYDCKVIVRYPKAKPQQPLDKPISDG